MLATGQHNECVLLGRPRHRNGAHPPEPRTVLNNDNYDRCPLPHAMLVECSIPVSNCITGPGIGGFGAIVEAEAKSTPAFPGCQLHTEMDHESQLNLVLQRLRSCVLQIRFRCHRLSYQFVRSRNTAHKDHLRTIQHALRDILRKLCNIRHQWCMSQVRFRCIRALLLHTNNPLCSARLRELQQSSALHTYRSLICLQPRLERINSLISELLSQVQPANTAAQAHQRFPQLHANDAPQAAAMLPALLPGPGNVVHFQVQVEEVLMHTDSSIT